MWSNNTHNGDARHRPQNLSHNVNKKPHEEGGRTEADASNVTVVLKWQLQGQKPLLAPVGVKNYFGCLLLIDIKTAIFFSISDRVTSALYSQTGLLGSVGHVVLKAEMTEGVAAFTVICSTYRHDDRVTLLHRNVVIGSGIKYHYYGSIFYHTRMMELWNFIDV